MKDTVDKQSILAAALTMTSIEVFSGGSEVKGYENLSIGKRIIRLTGGASWWLENSDSMMLLQIFQCLQTIIFTSGWCHSQDKAFDDRHKIGDRNILSDPTEARNEAAGAGADTVTAVVRLCPGDTLDISYGISTFTLRCLVKIVRLSKVKHDIQAKGIMWSRENAEDLMKLEPDIFDALDCPEVLYDRPTSGFLDQSGISDHVSEEVKSNHVLAFHYRTTLFFRRALCDGTATIVPPIGPPLGMASASQPARPTGQALVSMALEHLENIDALSSGLANASTLWPGFIAAVEAMDMELSS